MLDLVLKLIEVVDVPWDEDTAWGVHSLQGELEITSKRFDISFE